ncbi:SRPBCC family protein [uncultured Mycolicibacterium sp.]|uniref:type II toxin-antitoxin system Rv0910 family toxin n=1 Tax=uncultured Mycolicibacterium sp. TaxID=2320817 RepID=UPI00262E90A8|nr:SRPBCC family protein [uncultured Mycolicibacterium sp.]
MATVDVAVSSPMSPQRAWAVASDLRRFGEWLTIFAGWRGPVPDRIGVGTTVRALIRVKGFRNVVAWRVTRYDAPDRIELAGRGRGGVRIGLTLSVAENRPGSTFRVVADLAGGLLSTRVGDLVARVVASDVRRSVTNLARLG